MDGVIILNSYNTYSFIEVLQLIIGIIGIVLCFSVTFVCFDYNIIISGFFAGLMITMIGICWHIPRTETTYEVIVNENVTWQEFTEHYHVINARGKILKVTEINNGEN